MSTIFSPHIFVYKPQTNSVFSLFLRFILISVFLDFVFYSVSLVLFNSFILNYLVDLIYFSEIIVVFYVLSFLGEDFIDYDSVNLNYWDIDLVTFFRFFFIFFIFLIVVSVSYLLLQGAFWTNLVFY